MPDTADPSSPSLGLDCIPCDIERPRAPDESFGVAKLHDRSRHCWAVIGYPSGAIAERPSGEMLMRLREQDARDIAFSMTQAAKRQPLLN